MTLREEFADTADHEMFMAAAVAELDGACAGWRLRQRCVDEHQRQLGDPHANCLAAQQRYVRFLLDHGLTTQ